MEMLSTPGYRDLFDEDATLDDMLAGLSSSSVIKMLSWINIQLNHTTSPHSLDVELRSAFTSTLVDTEIAELGVRLHRSSAFRKDARVFHEIYVTYFIHYELTHYRNLPDEEIDERGALRFFKAYLLVVDIFNDSQHIPQSQAGLKEHDFFNQSTWPMLFKQYEFNRRVDPLFESIRLLLLIEELQKSEYKAYLTKYCQGKGCTHGRELVLKLLGLVRDSFKSNDGKTKINRFVHVSTEYHALLDSLSHPTSFASVQWQPETLKTMKAAPLFKAGAGEYVILNWSFFCRSIYEATLRDFYYTSGIDAKLPTYGDFKKWVAKEITEKRLFQSIVKLTYSQIQSPPLFAAVTEEHLIDASVRQGREVVMLECKDTDMRDSHQAEFDYSNFLKDMSHRHLRNQSGHPKSLLQLARNAREMREGRYPSSFYGHYRPKDIWVHPVLVCSGYLYSAPGLNSHLNELYQANSTTRTAPLVLLTLEFLFLKIEDLKKRGYIGLISDYHEERRRRQLAFQLAPSAESAFHAFSSIEEICAVQQPPYKTNKGFVRELFEVLGIIGDSSDFLQGEE